LQEPLRVQRVIPIARKVSGWPKDASWPMHSCGNAAING
jgi:hypothetical protein